MQNEIFTVIEKTKLAVLRQHQQKNYFIYDSSVSFIKKFPSFIH